MSKAKDIIKRMQLAKDLKDLWEDIRVDMDSLDAFHVACNSLEIEIEDGHKLIEELEQ